MNEYLPRSMPYEQAVRAIMADAARTAKRPKSTQEYDDQQAVDFYLVRYWTQYLGAAEKGFYNYGMRLAKAQYRADTPWGRQVGGEFERDADEDFARPWPPDSQLSAKNFGIKCWHDSNQEVCS